MDDVIKQMAVRVWCKTKEKKYKKKKKENGGNISKTARHGFISMK